MIGPPEQRKYCPIQKVGKSLFILPENLYLTLVLRYVRHVFFSPLLVNIGNSVPRCITNERTGDKTSAQLRHFENPQGTKFHRNWTTLVFGHFWGTLFCFLDKKVRTKILLLFFRSRPFEYHCIPKFIRTGWHLRNLCQKVCKNTKLKLHHGKHITERGTRLEETPSRTEEQ